MAEQSIAALFSRLWEYRWPVRTIFKQNLVAPFRSSHFGLFWNLLLPLVPVTAYLFLRLAIAPRNVEDAMNAAVYVAVGVTIWFALTDTMVATMNAVKNNRLILAESSFPIMGVILAGYAKIAFEFILRLILVIAVIGFLQEWPGLGTLMFIPLFIIALAFFAAIGMLLLSISFFFPDIDQIISVGVRYLIFLSLAIFPLPLEGTLGEIVMLNPFAFFIEHIRALMVFGSTHMDTAAILFLLIVPFTVLGAVKLLAKLESSMRSLI